MEAMKNKIKAYYQKGYWNREMVADAVEKGVITQDDFEEITGVR